MVHHHRTQLEIICDVLELCLEGANKHKIIYDAELTTETLNRYLDMLLSSGLVATRVLYGARVRTPRVRVVYETTESGKDFLEVCLNVLFKLQRARKTRVRIRPLDRTYWKKRRMQKTQTVKAFPQAYI